jgi:hypothetical protein
MPSVDYHPHLIELRVNGWLFRKILLVVHSFDRVKKYNIAVDDPTFGRFEISGNMVVEWKVEGRWYLTKPQLVVDHILTHKRTPNGVEPER